MIIVPRLLLTGSLALFAGLALQAGSETKNTESRVEVVFVEPEKFADVREALYDTDRANEQVLQELRTYLERTGSYYLQPGQSLQIRITDIDLAGDFEPWHGPDFDHIRILKEIYPPSVTLEFRLTGADGKVRSEGRRELRELGYLMTIGMPSWDHLRFEKEMLRAWLWREFKRV